MEIQLVTCAEIYTMKLVIDQLKIFGYVTSIHRFSLSIFIFLQFFEL